MSDVDPLIGQWAERQHRDEGAPGDRGKIVRFGGKQGNSVLVAREHTGLLEWWPVDALNTEGGRPVYLVAVPECDHPREVEA